ncbi:hypothetical protein L4Z64_001249 [Pseudomonas aeruginosa]|nr:hypothetical protein [Pseudomonas aeruginosa]MCS8414879.1 hypothetical protein [Pseudomonas aeruginosa]MCS9764386.1 hypothetical protein [Pseudomonas aeruginosa]MCS9822426.1 hypothetical protein [Pseudomonas aeruginosa]MCT0241143.1 hypothetical protein [Pseudomonas aeruginosa]
MAETPLLKIIEHPANRYAPSISANATAADLTVAIAVDFTTRGEQCAKQVAAERYCPILLGGDAVDAARLLYREVKARRAGVLNITGNESFTLAPLRVWTQDCLNEWVGVLIGKVHQHLPLAGIRSCGQSGVESAAAAAGVALGLPVTMLLPRGLLRRTPHGDRRCNEHELRQEIEDGAATLRPILESYGIKQSNGRTTI